MSMIEKKELIDLRLYQEGDKNFIYSTWLKGLYYGDSWFSEVPKDIFMLNYHSVIQRVLEHPNTVITVACLKDDPEVILGYAVQTLDGTTVHWVFTKKSWRNIGIAASLVSKDTNTVTHLTKAGLSIIKKHPGVVFNPFKQ